MDSRRILNLHMAHHVPVVCVCLFFKVEMDEEVKVGGEWRWVGCGRLLIHRV